MITQQFHTFFKVAKLALGADDSKPDPVAKAQADPTVNLMVPKSAAELKSAFGKVFG